MVKSTKNYVRELMVDRLKARQMVWEISGPPDTSIERIQCWSIPEDVMGPIRLVIVEIYKDNAGYEVFPQIMTPTEEGTVTALSKLSSIE